MSKLIPKHGGYRKLISFQISQLVYDVTVRFCDLYIDKYSLKLDYEDFLRQRNLSQLPYNHPALMRFKEKQCKKLEEVRSWVKEEREIAKQALKEKPQTINDDHGLSQTKDNNIKSVQVIDSPCQSLSPCSLSSSALVANAALSLLNLACHLLDRQIDKLAEDFENEGGFTEKLYRIRMEKRKNK